MFLITLLIFSTVITHVLLTDTPDNLCRYRDDETLYPVDLWVPLAGYGCYFYTNNVRLNFRYGVGYLDVTRHNITYKIPYSMYNDTAFLFDYTNEDYLNFLKLSFKTDEFLQLWVDCSKEADDCCKNHMDLSSVFPSDEFPCPAIWDGWSCFSPATANSVAKSRCPMHAYTSGASMCTLDSQKECFSNGTWNQNTDYSVCSLAPVYKRRHEYHVLVLYISIFTSLPAVIIYCSFRKLRVMRVIHHRNLIIIIIIKNILTITSKSVVILDALKDLDETKNIMAGNSVACRTLAFFEGASKNAIYGFMLADGYYLHKLIVRIFAKDPKMYLIYILVAVSSFTPSILWAIFKALYEDNNCWMVDEGGYQWISDGFRITVLSINTLLLLDIVRVLLLKLRQSSTVNHTKSTVKATLFLIPLFGLHIILVANRNIVGDTCFEEDIFFYTSYTMEALQGTLVATFFCYFNSEVHKELKNAYRKIQLFLQQRFNIGQPMSNINNRRRTTAATYVQNNRLSTDNPPKELLDLPQTENNVQNWINTQTYETNESTS